MPSHRRRSGLTTSLSLGDFARRLGRLQQRLGKLRRGGAGSGEVAPVAEMLADLETSLEDLAASGAELRQENDELAERRDVLEARHRRYLELFEFAPETYLVVDERGVIREANRASGALFGVRPDRLPGMPMRVFLGPFERRVFAERLRALRGLPRGATSDWESEITPRGRAPVPVAITMGVILGPFGQVVGARMLFRDIGEIVRMQAELKEAAERLKGLSKRLADSEEAARRKVARALHGKVRDPLAAVTRHLAALRAAIPETSLPELASLLDASMAELESVRATVEDVVGELRPAVLDQCGLAAALRWYAGQLARRGQLAVLVRAADNGHRLPEGIETALFRIAQEALANVACHAGARRATVTLEHGKGTVLSIVDDGCGFDTTVLEGRCPRGGWGIDAMRERAEAVGGVLSVHSGPGRGTVITVSLPA